MRHANLVVLLLGSGLACGCDRSAETTSTGPGQPTLSALPAPPADTPQAALRRLKPHFRKCRSDHLAEVHDMAGTVELLLTLDDVGNVLDVAATPTGTVTSDVAACVAGYVRATRFQTPAPQARSLKLAVTIADEEDDEETAERAAARRAADAMHDDIEKCYSAILESHPDASGRLVVEASVSSSGAVDGGRIVLRAGSLPAELDSCVLDIVRSVSFPPPRDGRVVVRIPIVLKRESPP